MPTNVEIKAKLLDRNAIETRVAGIADFGPEEIIQEDVFFNTTYGRLKLRIFDERRGELIYYERDDQPGPKISSYFRVQTDRPSETRQMLESACGVRGTVKKRRRVYLMGNTRIHLDTVEGLGEFLELEVVLGSGQQPRAGHKIAMKLMNRLGIREVDLVNCAYVDLILSQAVASRALPQQQ